MKKHQTVHYVLFTMVLASLCACSNPEKKALNSFKPIISFVGAIRNDDGSRKFSDFSFNVRRTDSVVSPFAGEITFKEETDKYRWTYTCEFARQDGRWVHKSIDSDIDISAGYNFLCRRNIDEMLSKFLGCPPIYNFIEPAPAIVRAEVKEPPLRLASIAGGIRPIATINNVTFAVGEEQEVRVEGVKVKIRLLEIHERSVMISLEKQSQPIELKLTSIWAN